MRQQGKTDLNISSAHMYDRLSYRASVIKNKSQDESIKNFKMTSAEN